MAIFGAAAEKKIVAQAKKQDAAAIKAIYDAHVQYLAAVCRRYIPGDDDAKDVLQDALIKAFTSLESFSWKGPGSLRAWMRRITVNEALMWLRRNASSPLSGERPEDLGEQPADEDPDTDGVPLEVLQRLIRGLPEGYRSIFNLHVFEELPHKEIASMLGISEGTSYSQFSRAKALLARKIKEYRKNGK